MTRYENKIATAETKFLAWVKAQNFPKGTPISFTPTPDRMKAAIIDIGVTLSSTQKTSLEALFPELIGKEV